MTRVFAFVAVLAASLTVAVVSAQSRPELSGQWTLVREKSAPPNTWAMGREFTIAQSATTLSIEIPMTGLYFNSDRSNTTTGEPSRVTYNLNGPETRHVVDSGSPSARQVPGSLMTLGIEESASTATWAGDHLVLVTNSTLKTTGPNREMPVTRIRQTVRNVLSLDKDGTLLVEHLVTVDPPTSDPGVGQPGPVKSVYRKTPR